MSPALGGDAAHRPRRHDGSPDDEDRSFARVVESLVAAFPAVPEPRIRDCVDDLRSGFAGARIRTYLPILVARQARAALQGQVVPAGGPDAG